MKTIIHLADIVINTPQVFNLGPATPGELLDNIFKFLYYLIGVIGVAMITYSGFLYVTSVGNSQKTKQALQSIIYTAVGFAIAIMARAVVDMVVVRVNPTTTLPGLITDGLSIFLWVIGITSVFVMIVAGIQYATSIGDPQKTKTAKDTILYAAVGLVVALLAGAIMATLNTFLTTGHF